MEKLTHLFYWLFKAKGSGLKIQDKDPRDFNVGIFGWLDYTPKYQRHIINTLSVRDQKHLNTCQWCATTVQKEIDEQKRLSLRSLVVYAARNNMLSGDGYSTLSSGQKALKDWGIEKEGRLSEEITAWTNYKTASLNYLDAEEHKTKSYWAVNTRNEILKLLDDNRILTTGIMWYTGFNQGGGFKSPWIIDRNIGYKVGGHAFVVIGYNLNYQGKKVYICQNSYGALWGDDGKFYIDMDFFDRNNYGFYTNLDVDKNVGEIINKYDGQNVKGDKSSAIYHIQKGQKKPYLNWLSFLAWNGKQRGFTEVPQADIDAVEEGDFMDITKTTYWQFLQDVKQDNQLDVLLTILNKEN